MIDHPVIVIAIVLVVAFGMLLIELPIALSLGLSGLLGVFLLEGPSAINHINYYFVKPLMTQGLLPVPLYIWMGLVLFKCGFGSDLYETVNRWMGRLPGGLAIAGTWACALFGVISGSSTATAMTMGSVSIPEMQKRGYSDSVAAGVMASAGGLAILIPPSTVMIIYAAVSDTSIGKLFFAGFIPGALLAILMSAYLLMRGTFTPKSAPKGPSFSWKERFSSLSRLLPVLLLFLAIFGGIYTGVFTPEEAGGIGLLLAIIIGLAYRRFKLRTFWDTMKETSHAAGTIYIIVVGAIILAYFFFLSGLNGMIKDLMLSWALPPLLTMVVMMFMMMLLGMILDVIGLLYVCVPVFLPIAVAQGIDPILFGIFMVVSAEMALITPPVAVNLYAIHGVSGIPVSRVAKGALPYVGIFWILFLILALFPSVALWLPNRMWAK